MSSALREAIDTTTLGWIKPELDETLRRAREEIEAFVDDGDAGHMRTCAGHMHQVHGTLRMVELYAPALVAEEMERLALALHRGEIDDREEACASLMRGAVLLPDYLERLQSGHRDIPIVLLPLLNELRASRGEAGLSESVLFSPDLDRPLPDYVPALQSAAAVGSAPARNANQARLAALREALAAWPEDGAPGDAARLATALDALLAEVELEPLRRMLWVAASVAAALRDGVMPPSRGLRQAFGGVEREARNLLSEDHFGVPLGEPTAEPTRQLLYHVAHTAVSHPSLDALRETFDLAAHLPSERELEHARGSLSGRNRVLLDTVSAAIKEDLLRVKDALDLHLRTGSGQVAELQPQVEVLARVADTLSMMGLGQAASVVLQQRDAMREIVAGRRLADESALLDVAGALLFVDAALDDQVARLGDGDAAGAAQDDLLASESRKVLDVVVREAIANFSDARQAFVAFVETNWDHSELAEVPRLLDEVGGALRILDLPGPADLLVGVKRYAERELIARRRVPSGQQLDTLADALASLEYYLEALRDRRPNRDNILDIARQSLEALGYWPLPVEEAPLPPVGAPLIEDEIAQALQLDRHTPVSFDRSALVGPTPPLVPKAPVEAANSEAAAASPTAEAPPAGASPAPAPTAPAPAPVAAGVPALGGFEHSDDIDDEIREVFLEELDEEVRNLSELLPAWHENPDDVERLRPIRRVFHTLKGSGRLVGAKTLGEFSWKIESLLNRVLDGSRPASPAVIAMVGHAYDTLPQLREALRSGAPVRADLAGLEACAERLATGEEILYTPPAPPPVAEPEPEPQAAVPAPLERDGAEADIGLEELAAEVEALVAAEEAQAETAETAGLPEAASEWSEAEALADDDWGVPAAVDSVLLEILSAEANGHLATIEQWLADAEGSADGHPATEPLRRAIHTLNGAFAMTEVPVITDITGPAETYVKRLLAAGQAADAEGVSAMTAVAAAVRRTLEALQSPMPRVPRFEGLAERIAALRDSLPEARSPMLVEPDEAPAPEVEEISPLDLTAFAPEPTIGAPRAVSAGDSIVQVAVEAEGAGFGEASAEAGDVVVPPAVPANLALVEAERLEAERREAERREAERREAERLEAERLEAERLEAERLEAERLEAERLEAERLEAERLEAERLEAERLEAERLEAERLEAERLEAERLEAERREAERLEAERLEAERREAERREAERLEAERREAERREAERLEAERLEAERLEAERLEAERREAERREAERREAERREAERREAERREAERFEAERREAERLEAERLEAERLEAERLEAERLEAERLEAERLAREAAEAEAERLADEAEYARLEAEYEAERLAREALARAQAAVEQGLAPETEDAAPTAATPAAAAETGIAASDAGDPPDPDQPLDMSDLDADLLEIFIEEGRDILDHADGLIAQLREAPGDREPLVALQRDLHTLKGGARMAGIMAVGELGHAMETLLEAVAEQRTELGRDGVALLERGFDRLHAMVGRVAERRALAMPSNLIAMFDARASGKPLPLPAAPAEAATSAEAPADAPAPQPAPTKVVPLKPLSAPIGEGPAAEDDDAATRAPQEMVRVRADLLDRLVNYAGEVAIYRARLEQQLGAFRAAIAEMAQTNTRLRDQLRRLEIETEAQIMARYQRQNDLGDEVFDPLELDRFSTLQQLSRALAESAADQASLQATLDDLTRQYETLLLQQSRVSSELQEGLMRTRMVPFEILLPRLRRVLRQAAGELGKQVQLKLEGAQGELDRNVLERMTAPLEHMLRNAVAHGLETPELRRAAGKPEEGTVRIALRREGSEIVLEIGDDGAGLNREAIRRRGEERGLIRPGAILSNVDLDSLIFEPGFSTAETVSRLAGRGVGMDVVAAEVRQLGGTVEIHSTPGQGTTFTLRLPQTLAVTQAVFVRIGETTFAVPIASVRGVGRVPRDRLEQPDATYRYGDEDYPIHDLGVLIGHAPAKAEGHLQMPLLLIRSGDLRAAVCIDQVVGNREIVVKPVGPQIASIPGIFGATIMGDGRVVVILDVAPLVRRHALLPRAEPVAPAPAVEQRRVPLVMVVDDSVTMRKVTGRVLERHNFEVMTAKDGIDALERMAERVPDLMLLDIEMPRMDGYELAGTMRNDSRLRDVPIIMITSRTGEKHRQRAFELGVNRYLGKPYQEPELMRNVFELLGMAREHE